jgi:hypothetical protein
MDITRFRWTLKNNAFFQKVEGLERALTSQLTSIVPKGKPLLRFPHGWLKASSSYGFEQYTLLVSTNLAYNTKQIYRKKGHMLKIPPKQTSDQKKGGGNDV